LTRIPQIFANSKLAVFSLCLIFAFGWASLNSKSGGTWRASVGNGDKPGIGIELSRTGNEIRGFIYLLDPNKAHDFTAGSRFPMEIHQTKEREIWFAVNWFPDRHEELVLRLNTPLSSNSVHAVLQSADGKDDPRDFEFIRIK
jgi:hypothetical protein